MSSASQKALLIPSKGAKFEVGTRTIPKPGPGQVLVRLYAAALNPVDNYIQQFGVFVESYPAVAGSDGAGTVEELGEGATGVAKGDKVFFQGLWVSDRGTFQQYALADAIPTKYSFDDVATIPLGFATAAIGLYAKRAARGGAELATPWSAAGRDKYKGQPAVVIGGSSSVGQFALQLLKLSGFGPIITTASASNAEYAKAAGATDVIDYHTTPYAELPAAVAKITSTPVPVIYDAISSPESQQASWKILAPKGSLVVTLQPAVGKPGEEAEDGKRLVQVFGSSNHPENREIGNDIYAHLTGLLETGAVKPNKVEILPDGLAGIPAGVARLEQKGVSGVKLVARPQETA
ncbi:hypothetical protein EWM64_g1603 [Hericium alpestre]|uniref:Enoyl reductase (ER) domain-containing protein n=1 Tax=Hericium alpestre TaxID=135208 RepID=A0A4Z0A6P9_9AGAM|nr:hypothetical protein EWM64_g1603 [Hericium alpestre]